MPERFGGGDYRYGFNGMEKDDEISGEGNSYTAEFWQYDSRLGRRWNIDPVVKTHESPYATFANSPIYIVDPSGADWIYYNEDGQELNRTKSSFFHFHWLTGDKKITLTKSELEKGGFFGYVSDDDKSHVMLLDVKSKDVWEAMHPTVDGKVVDGFKNSEKGGAKSQIYHYKWDGKSVFGNEDFWTYKLETDDSPRRGHSVSVVYIWVPDRQAVLDKLNKQENKQFSYNVAYNNCKNFTIDAIVEGFNNPNSTEKFIRNSLIQSGEYSPLPSSIIFDFNESIDNPFREKMKQSSEDSYKRNPGLLKPWEPKF